ncbi:MAG: IS4 family transposase [Phycisphaerae bacterium]
MIDIGHGGPGSQAGLELPAPVVVLEALSRFIPPTTIRSVLTGTGRHSRRIRRLPAEAVVWLVIAIGIWTECDIPSIWRQVAGTLRSLLLFLEGERPPSKAALSQSRSRLGPSALRQVFVATAAPIARHRTRGAFYKRMRLLAMDGARFEMPDTPANGAAFGRPSTRRDGQTVQGGYPQCHAILLTETGTHVVLEAYIKRGRRSEFSAGIALLRKVPPGCLVLQDRGFYGYRPLAEATRRGVQVLGRVASHVRFDRIETLRDGSYLAAIYPSSKRHRRHTDRLVVRVIEYTLDEPNRTGHGERHRLVTTLLNAHQYPARELAVLYHDRWEIELGIDEIKTHQLRRHVHLRSRTPRGVLQELYGIQRRALLDA